MNPIELLKEHRDYMRSREREQVRIQLDAKLTQETIMDERFKLEDLIERIETASKSQLDEIKARARARGVVNE